MVTTKFVSCALTLLPLCAVAQPRVLPEFHITGITRSVVTTPQFSTTLPAPDTAARWDQWLQVEANFSASTDVTDDLTFKYFILIGGRVLTGEVTHTNILGGRDLHSVVYVAPHTLARLLGNRPVTINSVQNITVQIVQQGAIKDESTLLHAAPQWYTTLPQLAGFVLNKNETPFAPLNWDRYEQIKPR